MCRGGDESAVVEKRARKKKIFFFKKKYKIKDVLSSWKKNERMPCGTVWLLVKDLSYF